MYLVVYINTVKCLLCKKQNCHCLMNYSETAYQKAFFPKWACLQLFLSVCLLGQGGGDGGSSDREMLGILLWSSGWPST